MIFFLQSIPEKQPALLSLIYVGGLALAALLLGVALLRYARRRSALASVAPSDLPPEVRKRLGVTSTNRGLHAVRIVFVLLALTVYGFHVYWASYAEEENQRFQELSYKDLRNRRLAESTLRGWIYDRTGSLDRALALYRRGADGRIVREYPNDAEFAQLFGTDRGDPGLERALFGIESGAAPEAYDLVLERGIKQPGQLDVRLTIDRELQKAAVEQLRGRHGAVVVLNPQTGEVLALYSNPSYTLAEAQDGEAWIRLDANKRDQPLVNRALRSYYIPGSTFKTVTMIAAYVAGMQGTKLTCSGNGYVAAPGAPAIFDDQGPGEVHGQIGIDTAYEVSCNQYFAQLAVRLGPQKMEQAAKLVGIFPAQTPEEARVARLQPDIWNASSRAVARALAPYQATMVTGPKIKAFDLALEGYGQGYAGQMTPFQMALAASTIANLDGKLMKTKIEYDLQLVEYHRVVTPQQAAEMRAIMGLVTGGASGTARGVFAPVHAAGIITGGKTGTAQKDVPVYDPKTGEVKTVKRQEKDRRGNVIREWEEIVMSPEPRIDGWFLCIAPLNNPQLAMAVIIEGGGYGGRSAAPVAAALVLKARELGLLGMAPAPAGQQRQGQGAATAAPPAARTRTRPRPRPTRQ
jgi:cell division protein FtsI/penicillin-binding protein 2